MKIFGSDDLLTGLELPFDLVPIPELRGGGFAIVRGMTALERGRYEQSLIRDDVAGGGQKIYDPAFGRAELLARTLVANAEPDPTKPPIPGERLYTDEDATRLQGLRADVADRLFAVAKKLSGLTREDLNELKNACAGAQTGASPSS